MLSVSIEFRKLHERTNYYAQICSYVTSEIEDFDCIVVSIGVLLNEGEKTPHVHADKAEDEGSQMELPLGASNAPS